MTCSLSLVLPVLETRVSGSYLLRSLAGAEVHLCASIAVCSLCCWGVLCCLGLSPVDRHLGCCRFLDAVRSCWEWSGVSFCKERFTFLGSSPGMEWLGTRNLLTNFLGPGCGAQGRALAWYSQALGRVPVAPCPLVLAAGRGSGSFWIHLSPPALVVVHLFDLSWLDGCGGASLWLGFTFPEDLGHPMSSHASVGPSRGL